MEASGGNGQAVADEATAAEVVLSVDQGEVRICPAAEMPLQVDQGDTCVSPANEVGVLVNQGDARVGVNAMAAASATAMAGPQATINLSYRNGSGCSWAMAGQWLRSNVPLV